MSILIKGMEMPTACRHGECNFACSAAYQTGLICIARKQYVVPGDVPRNCPCSLVPPHGRLIDADKLKEEFPHDEDWDYPVNTNSYVVETIDKSPTIIEAEEGE